MRHIDEKYKDMRPEQTVEHIRELLGGIGINMVETWNVSGIENCWSLTVSPECGFPSSNGKGVSRELARASAYGEFIERLQSGLFLYKFQSIERDPKMNLQTYAPDMKYMTLQELEEHGEWMDYLIQTYGSGLTRAKIAQQCKMYACTDEDRVLTIPFYSLFEDKHVYLPAAFVEHIYSANGCCVGNTREEAWVHALSEIMERKCDIAMLMSGTGMPEIPAEVLAKFPTVSKILNTIHENGKFDVKVFDASFGNGFPVVCTRIINKMTGGYVVNTGADPILEIAVERTLTEIFQGRNIETFNSLHSGRILNHINDFPQAHNVLNLLETGNGMFAADFFAEELTCQRECTKFDDNSGKNNKQLVDVMLKLYRDMNRPVYVRNYSFLGFCCYKFVVPGFSESRGLRLNQKTPEYALGDEASKTLRNPMAARDDELSLLLMYHKLLKNQLGYYNQFGRLAGLPVKGRDSDGLLPITMSYAAYRLKNYAQAIQYLDMMTRSRVDERIKAYFSCVQQYIKLKSGGHHEEKIRIILNKFFDKQYADQLYACLEKGGTPYDEYLLRCDCRSCSECRYHDICFYQATQTLIERAGQKYQTFADGQNKKEFAV